MIIFLTFRRFPISKKTIFNKADRCGKSAQNKAERPNESDYKFFLPQEFYAD